MSIQEKEPSEIKNIIKENLSDKNVIFVFPTDIDTTSWADWAVMNPQESGIQAVDMTRFLPWDKFKENYLSAKKEGLSAIPSVLRKFFIRKILKENAEAKKNGKPLIFTTIINSDFAENSSFFTDWLSNNLSALDMWHKRFLQAEEKGTASSDGEDKDYENLYQRYSSFLEENNLFEQAWIESDFSEDGHKFILFYPEILEDFLEYEANLKKVENIQIIKTPSLKDKTIPGTFYENSRTEIRKTALKIRELNERGVSWTQIAVHVPKLEEMKPYIEREFKNYCIPFVSRAGLPFTRNSAGSIFVNLNECVKNNFSYESVRELLLNGYIPWKKLNANGEMQKWTEDLIRIGSELHCVCAYKKKLSDEKETDNWIESLNASGNKNYLYLEQYKRLKNAVEEICEAKSFKEIQEKWFAFKASFLDEKEFSLQADNILSRSIKYLQELILIEEKYLSKLNMMIDKPFDFFVNELNGKTYTPQSTQGGVSIFGYKVAACSAFKYNFVIGASQNDVSISYKQLDFLNDIKRKTLGIGTVDVSKQFLWLYNKFSGENEQYFSASQQTFDGFAIPNNFLSVPEKIADENLSSHKDKEDFVRNENNWFWRSGKDEKEFQLQKISENQKEQFEAWGKKIYSSRESSAEYSTCQQLDETVHYKLYEDPNRINEKNPKTGADVIKITQSDLTSFNPCPRKWLFQHILRLKEDSLETDLFDSFEMGTLYHLIIQLSLTEYKEKLVPLRVEKTVDEVSKATVMTFGKYDSQIKKILDESFEKAVVQRKYSETPLIFDIIKSQKNEILKIIYNMLIKIFSDEKYSGSTPSKIEEQFWSMEDMDDICLYGKIDCILTNEENGDAILDYKKSHTATSKECTAQQKMTKDGETHLILRNFQMPLYAKLAKDNDINVESAAFVSIQNAEVKKTFGGSRSACKDFDDYEETINVAVEAAKDFKYACDSMNFEPVIDSERNAFIFDPNDTCTRCNFKSVCRSIFKIAGSKIKRV